MKSRTLLLPMAFTVPAFFATVPENASASAPAPVAARSNALLGELDTVVAGARHSSILLDGRVAAVAPVGSPSSQCNASRYSKTKGMNVKLGPTTATVLKSKPTPLPVKKSNPTTHKA